MSNPIDNSGNKQLLERLSRQGSQDLGEVSIIASTGAGTIVWVVKVKSLESYNIYNVSAVEIGEPGEEPTEAGPEVQAVNLAESFTQQGQLPVGTYVVIVRVGERDPKNVFHAPV